MARDETAIEWAKRQMAKEVTSDGLKPLSHGDKIISLPTWLLIAIVGGGGGYFTFAKPELKQDPTVQVANSNAARALFVAEAAASELASRRAAINSISAIGAKVEALSSNQRLILSDVGKLRQEIKVDIKDLQDIILDDISRRETR